MRVIFLYSRFVVSTLVALLLVQASAFSQLPDESQLPTPASPVALPDESQLPIAGQSDQTKLPDEMTLPGDGPAASDDLRPSDLSPGAMRPWLRLRFDGHTGTIRAIALSDDGQYLLSAGEDKDLHVWSRQMKGVLPDKWFHRRTIRWQVERGPRGRIYAVATKGNLAAIAGHGAMGGLGEIWIVDLTTGNLVHSLVDTENGHRQVIASLAWQPGAKNAALASVDAEGRVLLWKSDDETGIWSARTIVGSDRETYGESVSVALAPRRRLIPITFLDEDHLLVPRYVGPATEPAGAARWQIQRYQLSTNTSDVVEIDHLEMITAMTASRDGRRLATADANGTILQASFGDNLTLSQSHSLRKQPVALSLAYSHDGSRMFASTIATATNEEAVPRGSLRLFDTSKPNVAPVQQSVTNIESHGWACAYDVFLNEVITVSNNAITSHSLQDNSIAATPSQRLAPKIGPARKVAFAKQSSSYRIALGTQLNENGTNGFSDVFDATALRLEARAGVDGGDGGKDWIDPMDTKGVWDLRLEPTPSGPRHFLYVGELKRGSLPLKGELHGLVTSAAWFSKEPEETDTDQSLHQAIVVGTDGRNQVYVYERGDAPEARLLRQFRGHTGTVLSIGVSADKRYLVSGSDDATVCIWKLEDIFSADDWTNRWGTSFEVQGNRLFAADVRRDGPLFFRGVRDGDELVSMTWEEDGVTKSVADSDGMRKALVTTPFDALIVFQFSRLGRSREAFQSFPAWQPVATLFVDQSREWAFWTPAGFYDASFGGDELFGWQINRGVSALPDYFRAAQFRQRLEKPEAMRRLLSTGDLATAMERGISGIAPPPGEEAIVNQILTKPIIRLKEPLENQIVASENFIVEAEITIPKGSSLVPPKVFAGGVPATRRSLIRHDRDLDVERYVYRWNASLPSDLTVPLEIVAASESGATERVRVEVVNAGSQVRREPRLHFLSIGISDYSDPQITPLDFAARGAGVMTQLIEKHTAGLYRTTTSQLLNRDAIRPLWREYALQAARELASNVNADDLLVMYLCGHGIRDRRTNQWYFVTADARYRDLMNDRYDDLLSFDDLAMLGELPCRKLAIIDSCHSGAVQPAMRNDDLKSVMRMLQGDVVFTMTASEGEEEAVEQTDRQLGRYTSHLVEALQGRADLNDDGIISLNETIRYVSLAAAEDSRVTGFVQHPTAGPADLLDAINLPLTRSDAQ